MVIGGLIVAACFVIYAVMRLERKIQDTFFDIMSPTTRYKADIIAKGSKIEESIHEVNVLLTDIFDDFSIRLAEINNNTTKYLVDIINEIAASSGDDIDSDDFKERLNNTFNKVHDQILALQNSFEFRGARNENKFSEMDDKIDRIEDRIDDIENKLHYTVNDTAFSSMDQLLEERNN